MKILAWLISAVSVVTCSHKSEKLNNNSDDLGNCYLIESENSYFGLIHYGIIPDEGSETHNYLILAEKFEEKPSFQEFFNSSVIGHRIPNSDNVENIFDGSFKEKGEFDIGLDVVMLKQDAYLKVRNSLIPIGETNIDYTGKGGAFTYADSENQLISIIKNSQYMIGRTENNAFPFTESDKFLIKEIL